MKKLMSVLVIVALFSTSVVMSATFQFTGFGSMEKAINLYAVPNSTIMAASVHQDTPNGYVDVKSPLVINFKPTTKEAIDSLFRQKIESVAEGALTNSLVNKDGIFKIFGFTEGKDDLGIIYLIISSEFTLQKSSDGSYHLPDFSALKMIMPPDMVFEIPNLEWARIEASYNPVVEPYDPGLLALELDSRIDIPNGPPSDISITHKVVQISTDLATSGANGPTLLKISTVTKEGTNHVFRVFGPMGTQIPETPLRLSNFTVSDGQSSFQIIGGDPGRVLVVQCSTNSTGPWTDTGERIVVPIRGYPPLYFRKAINGNFGFYRVRSENAIPF